MSTPFLTQFSTAVVHGLAARGELEFEPGSGARVVAHLAAHLAGLPPGHSLISSVSGGLISCGDVLELYADNEAIKDVVNAMGEHG